MLGSSLVAFKAALIAELEARLPNVSYGSPVNAEDITGADGSGDAVWWSDDADGTHDVKVITGGPHWFDEEYVVTLVCQSLGRDTDADQGAVDRRATELLGEAIGILATDPTVGLSDAASDGYDPNIIVFTGLPAGWSYAGGILGQSSLRAARFEFDIRVSARLKLEAS